MYERSRCAWAGAGLIGLFLLTGCIPVGELINPELTSLLGGQQAAIVPGDAPGLLVSVRNETDRIVQVVVSHRNGSGTVNAYSSYLRAGDKSSQLLVCPLTEITVGSVTNLRQAGARVSLVKDLPEGVGPEDAPSIDVEPYGVLLKSGVNYNCGDAVEFTVASSSTTRSGYQVVARIRRAGS